MPKKFLTKEELRKLEVSELHSLLLSEAQSQYKGKKGIRFNLVREWSPRYICDNFQECVDQLLDDSWYWE
jgi:hypothetical protein